MNASKTKDKIMKKVRRLWNSDTDKSWVIITEEAIDEGYELGKAEQLKEFKKFLIECEGEIIGKCFIKNGFSKWAKLQEVKII